MDLGWLYHGLAGFGLNVAPAILAPWYVSWLIVPGVLGVFGYVREVEQGGWRWRLNVHKSIEAAAWLIGALGGAGLGLVV